MGLVYLFLMLCAVTMTDGKSHLSLERARGIMILKNVLHLHKHRLKIQPLATTEVSKEMKCTASCLKSNECFSFNVKKTAERNFLCELLNTSKLTHPENLTQDENFSHWFLQDPCVPNPCKYGYCIPGKKTEWRCDCRFYMAGKRCEQCEDPSHNFALGKPATQSSDFGNAYKAHFAVDGNNSTQHATPQGAAQCAMTAQDTQHWWRVDFETKVPVARVAITNRNCCPERLRDFEMMIGDSMADNGLGNPKCGDKHTIGVGLTESIICSPILLGRYLTINYYGDYMQICEVAVYCK